MALELRDAKAMAAHPNPIDVPVLGGRTFELATHTTARVLAVGADLKSAICLYRGSEATLSRPIGDLSDPRNYRDFLRTITQFEHDLGFTPDLIAHDLHPLHLATRFAMESGLPAMAVQHHHAHIASVMADWRIDRPVIGVCCDGIGYGTDGSAWGCEVLCCENSGFSRLGTLAPFPLVGGDTAAIQTWRPAAALLRQAFNREWRGYMSDLRAPELKHPCILSDADLEAAERLMDRGIATPMTSSLGRVFDGVSFLLGLCTRNDHEGQAAIALEKAAGVGDVDPYPYETEAQRDCVRMSAAPMIRALVRDRLAGEPVGHIAARFHETIARMLAVSALLAVDRLGLYTVVLAGGCFANQRLIARLEERLESRHVRVLSPRRVPCGDAGLALGQAVVAGAIHQEKEP